MNETWNASESRVVLTVLLAVLILPVNAAERQRSPYATYASFADLLAGNNAKYPRLDRISEPGTKESPNYTGFFFYQCQQFDPTDRYMLGMRVHCQNRDVQPTDRAEIGFIDLHDEYKWTQIGETTAWNWQQGARLQWRPGSDEILWNDRSDDGRQYVCRVYNFKTGARRTLPRPVYAPSPDGAVALTHDFERMKHGGTPYVGIKDQYEGQYSPKQTGIWRMDLDTGDAVLIMSLDRMAEIAYPDGPPASGGLYIFREGWNPSGSRFIAFVKDPDNNLDKAFSMSGTGTEVRYFYNRPSHHEWQDDSHILDGRGYYSYPDDGTGKAASRLFESSENGHVSYIPGVGGDWIVSDTYDIKGYQHLFMYHIPTKQFVPLARLKATAPGNIYRVDLHPRLSHDGRLLCIDATHEGLGRQMYIIDIGYILDNPPIGEGQQAQDADIPIPPAEHPRLYLRAEHVALLPQRLQDPVLRPAIERLQAQAKRSMQSKVEWDALQYLVTRDDKLGRATIEAVLPLLQKCVLADRQDACRETGRMMVTGAIVYDWCYSLLSPEEKQAFIKELVRLAGTQECGYPPAGQGSVTGHASEAMIIRDMLSAGIAIYDESPEMYRLAAGRFFREHLPVRNWFYNGHAYHQGDSYGPHRYSWDTYPLWIFDRLGAGNVYNPEQRFVPYLWIYTTRPDGQRLRAGDTFACSAPRGQPWSQYIGTLLTASYYGDGILLDQYQRQGGSGGNETIFEVLWRDTSLAAKPIGTLPLSRYFESPFGWMVARTGWDANAVIAEMKVNEYNFVNHQHLDAGEFQIYYKGALAIDSGLYEGGSSGNYGSPHCMNYYWRTIAHNSLLVYDPNENFGRRGYGNDGGQRLPNGRSEARNLDVLLTPENGYRTGKVLTHGFGPDPQTPDFTWLRGDLTEAYGKKVRQVTRSFVFLNLRNPQVPAAMVILDRVVSTNPAFRKYWLLHTLEEPRVESASAIVDCTQRGNGGRLMLDVLLPPATNMELTKVGGAGREYWVFGQNYTNDPDPKRLERSSIETGAWRIELSPKAAAAEDLFLAVMQVTDRQSLSYWPARRLDAGERVGCIIEGPETSWVVLIRRDNKPSGESVGLTLPGDRPGHMLVADLEPGRWHARREGSAEIRDLVVSEDSGAAWLEGPAGTWTLSH